MSCCGKKTLVGQALHGAAGLTKAVLGIERPPDPVVAARRDACRECPEATRNIRFNGLSKGLSHTSQCLACGALHCFIEAKTLVGGESCPQGKWPAWTPTP